MSRILLSASLAGALLIAGWGAAPAVAQTAPDGTPVPIVEPTAPEVAVPETPLTTEPPAEPVAAVVEDTGPRTVAGGVTPLPPGTHRLQGADRYATAVAISSRFSPGVSKVYIATGINYPDALSAAAVAGAEGVPLLLVLPTSIPAVVWTELQRLEPAAIVVAGGTTTVSSAVASQLANIAPVTRIAGSDRFETSRLLALQGAATGGTTYVATGLNFPDALSSAAAAGSLGSPVVLVNGGAGSVDSATVAALSAVGTYEVRIAGSSSAVSEGIRSSLSFQYPVTRYAGADRFETGALINSDAFSYPSTVYLALGSNFPDALAGGALAAATDAPLFIVRNDCIPTPVHDLLATWSPSTVVLLGSSASLTASVANLVECQAAPEPPTPPGPPANPGNTKNCGDFATWQEAQEWYLHYYPHYGDIAKLDFDNNGIACENLPGAP